MFVTNTKPSARGFTILEVMIATTVFAVILLVLTVGVLSFTRDYFSSVTRSNTQTAARAIMDDISRAIQFSQSDPIIITDPANDNEITALCIDNVAYFAAPGYEVSDVNNAALHQNKYGLIKRVTSTTDSCTAPPNITGAFTPTAATDKEMLGKHMRMSHLAVVSIAPRTYAVSVRVVYGDDDLLGVTSSQSVWKNLLCKSTAGSQYCAVSDLSTTVQQRITR